MNILALGLYGVAAIFGLILALRVFRQENSPMLMALLHMGFAVAGALTLIGFLTSGEAQSPLFLYAMIAYGVAALGGLFLFSYRFRDAGFPPKGIVIVHALVAVVGTLLLLTASFG